MKKIILLLALSILIPLSNTFATSEQSPYYLELSKVSVINQPSDYYEVEIMACNEEKKVGNACFSLGIFEKTHYNIILR